MGFGFPASYAEEFDDLGSEADLHGCVKEALESLGWPIRNESPKTITASTGMNWSSYGERLVIRFHPDGRLSVTSTCVFFAQMFDWGKNEANVRELISAVKSYRPRRTTRPVSRSSLPIVVTCASCDTRIKAPDSAAGKKVKCPKCATPVPVPAPEVEPFDEPDERGAEKQTERGRHQEEDERPARGQHRNGSRNAGRKEVNPLGVASLVMGGLALPFSLIPCVGLFALPWVGLGLLCGIVGFFVSKSRPNTGAGLPVAGTAVCLTAGLISIGWVVGINYLAKGEDAKRLKEEQALRDGPAIAVTAEDLFEQYRSDRATADSKYKGNALALSGTVVQVTARGSSGGTLELATDGETIDCLFHSAHKSDMDQLMRAQHVTIRGTCKGIVEGSVTLEKCILESVRPRSPDEPRGPVANIEPVVALTDKAPPTWALKRVEIDAKFLERLELTIIELPEEMEGGTLLIRDHPSQPTWLRPDTLTASKDVTVYVTFLATWNGKPTVPESTITAFLEEGWTELKKGAHTTSPDEEDWQLRTFKRPLKQGPVNLPLRSVTWPRQMTFYVFK